MEYPYTDRLPGVRNVVHDVEVVVVWVIMGGLKLTMFERHSGVGRR